MNRFTLNLPSTIFSWLYSIITTIIILRKKSPGANKTWSNWVLKYESLKLVKLVFSFYSNFGLILYSYAIYDAIHKISYRTIRSRIVGNCLNVVDTSSIILSLQLLFKNIICDKTSYAILLFLIKRHSIDVISRKDIFQQLKSNKI